MSDLIERINEYLGNGGFFNPELMDHDKVRDLLMDCRETLQNQKEEIASFVETINSNWPPYIAERIREFKPGENK